jgi:hypothetical protein
MVRVDFVLSILIGCFFFFMGLVKLFPEINLELYTELVSMHVSSSLLAMFPIVQSYSNPIINKRKEFGRYNKVFPFYQYTRWRPFAKDYRVAVAITESLCGFILIIVPGRYRLRCRFAISMYIYFLLYFFLISKANLKT